MKFGLKTLVASVVVASGLSSAVAAESTPLPFPGTITGNISVVSSYNLRGITGGSKEGSAITAWAPENDNAAIQGGLDYSHDSGLYLGYWFSTLGYSYASLNTAGCVGSDCSRKSFENDFYGGFKGKLTEDIGFQVGGTIYYYHPGWESTGYETIIGLNYKELSVTAQTLLNNVTFGNKGDTYFLATYAPALPAGFTGKFQVGAYYYGDDDEFLAANAKPGDVTKTDFAFRHATLGLSHPLGDTGATWSLDYIFGGYARDEAKQDNKAVLGLSYAF